MGSMACLSHAGYTFKSRLAPRHHVASTEERRVGVSFTLTCPALLLVLPRLFCGEHSNPSATVIDRQHGAGGSWEKRGRQFSERLEKFILVGFL